MMTPIAHIALLAPVFIPLAIAALLFCGAGRHNSPKLFLSFAMLNASFVFLGNYLYFVHDYVRYSYLHGFHIAAVLLIYPTFYYYLSLLSGNVFSAKRFGFHCIPALVFMLLSDSLFFPFLTAGQRVYFLSEYRQHPTVQTIWLHTLWIIRFANVAVLLLQIVYYSIKIYVLQKKHNAKVRECFSSPWNVNLNWLKIINISFVCSAVICVFVYVANPAKHTEDQRYVIFPFFLLSCIISVMGILGNSQELIFDDEIIENEEPLPDVVAASELKQKLEDYFEREKPYLQPELKIWDICTELRTNRTYISNAINEEFGMNFSQFVNQYRVVYAKELLRISPQKKMEDIALESGFGSQASLNRAYKLIENTTPIEFKRQLINQSSQ